MILRPVFTVFLIERRRLIVANILMKLILTSIDGLIKQNKLSGK